VGEERKASAEEIFN
jgi:hypothetical protein